MSVCFDDIINEIVDELETKLQTITEDRYIVMFEDEIKECTYLRQNVTDNKIQFILNRRKEYVSLYKKDRSNISYKAIIILLGRILDELGYDE